jgi:hypothetical protein
MAPERWKNSKSFLKVMVSQTTDIPRAKPARRLEHFGQKNIETPGPVNGFLHLSAKITC